MGKLDGKIALITGGSDGMGLATAILFVAEGAEHVYITGRRQTALDEAVKLINSKRVTAVQADVANMADLDKVHDVIKKEKGRLDIVFANAGVGAMAPVDAATEEMFDYVFNINVKGVYFTVQKTLPLIPAGGSIILNGSVSSAKAVPGESILCGSKAALRMFARCWMLDLRDRKIRVNVVSPGLIDTPAARRLVELAEENKHILDAVAQASALGRMGTAEEIAKAVLYFASDDSSFTTGAELFVDGGFN